MKLLSGYEDPDDHFAHPGTHAVHFRYEQYSNFITLSRTIVRCIDGSEIVLVIKEWGIWPSSEDWFLFDTMSLRMFGETHRMRPMQFCRSDFEALSTMLWIAMSFGWGGAIYADREVLFRFNHDGFAALYHNREGVRLEDIHGVSVVGPPQNG